jgi:hypothetical protein
MESLSRRLNRAIGPDLFRAACKMGLEGMLSKQLGKLGPASEVQRLEPSKPSPGYQTDPNPTRLG